MKDLHLKKPERMTIGRVLLFVLGLSTLIITAPVESYAFDVSVINWAIKELCGHITGGFGALLTSVAILGAVVSAALGSFRVFFGAIIVGVGSYAVPNILTMYFPGAAAQCDAPGGGRASKSAEPMVARSRLTTEEFKAAAPLGALPESAPAAPAAAAPSQSAENTLETYEDDEAESSRSWAALAESGS